MKSVKIILLLVLFGIGNIASSQNNSCANATPFCTGQTMNFPAGTGTPTSQVGPSYGCLLSQPNPAWFFMQMSMTGSMSISMSAATDIDFICWGPFPNLSGACNNLTGGNILSCSYSPSNTETCTIANAVAGQFYVLLITNFSNLPQNITFNQTNQSNLGAAVSNCGFVCTISGSVQSGICAGQSATVSLAPGTSTSILSYTWTGPNSFTSTSPNNVFTNLQNNTSFTIAGTNSAVINGVPYAGTCQAVVTVSVVQYPTFSVSPTSTNICQGANFFSQVVFTPPANPASYSYLWSPVLGAGIWQPSSNGTMISPLLLPPSTRSSTVTYSVMVMPITTVATCPVTKTLEVIVNNPLVPAITAPPPLCDIFSPLQLTATPVGGTWSGNASVNSTGLFTPTTAAIGTNSVAYIVSVGTCSVKSTQTISVSKYYSPALTSSLNNVCVLDPKFNLMNIVQNTVSGTWSGPQVSGNRFDPSGLATGTYSLTYNTTSLPDPTVCPASTVMVVPVYNPPLPVINTIPPHCTNEGTFALTATPGTGVWSGVPGVSPTGIQTTSANPIGTNTVLYTDGQGTCVATSSKTFHISQFNPATLTGTVPNLCVTSKPVTLMSIVQNSTGSWSGGGVYNNVFDPTGLPTNIYTITYSTTSFPDPALCPHSRSINVSVFNPPTPDIIQAGPFCTIDSPVQLVVKPATGRWVPTSFLSTNGTFSPGISSVGNNAVQYIIGTNTCNTQQTKFIQTEAFVQAAITSSISDQCSTGAQVNLLPITLSSSGNWTGAGISGTSFNPGVAGAGRFTLTYNTASIPSGLCPDKASISVNIFSLATPFIKQLPRLCNNAFPVQLQVSPVGGIFSSGIVGAVSPGGLFNPASTIIGDNIITYSISSGPCVVNAQTHIIMENFVSAAFEKYAPVYCEKEQAVNLNSLVQNPGGDWIVNGISINGSMFDPSKKIGANEIVYTTHSSPTESLCPDTKSITIKVKSTPTVSAMSSTYRGCLPVEAVLTSSLSGPGYGSWHLDDGSEDQKGLVLNYLYTNPGIYNVVFNFEDNEARSCSAQFVLNTIVVSETPKADFIFSPDEVTVSNPEVIFTNVSTPLKNNRYTWTVEGLGQTFDINRVVNFMQSGNYKVTLLASTGENCKDEITKTIEVKNDFNVFIPNSFTPNYDGINDKFLPVFSPYGLDTKTYSLEIFDRWGHEVFNTKDYTVGWDGTARNTGDESLKEDTYVFKLSYKDLNGRLYKKMGNIILIK